MHVEFLIAVFIYLSYLYCFLHIAPNYRMPTGKSCFVCKHTKAVDPTIHMHRTPKEGTHRQQWLEAMGIEEVDLPKDPRVCTHHFPDGDATKLPSLTLGKKFASPKKRSVPIRKPLAPTKKYKMISSNPSNSSCESHTVLSTGTLELPSTSNGTADVTVNAALMAKIEMLESKIAALKHEIEATERHHSSWKTSCMMIT